MTDFEVESQTWLEHRKYTPEKLAQARKVLEEVRNGRKTGDAIRRHPLPGGGYVGKHMLVAVYRELTESGEWPVDVDLLARIRLKPVRTLSGVATVTALTKPYPCPGECIFCPTDVQVPKSYVPDEPGVRRALQYDFDPYDQVAARVEALQSVGHPTDKIELLILGGTWSAYRRDYQEWFVKRCLDALNEDTSQSLDQAQTLNETAKRRNVGLVIETRPDHVSLDELAWLRRLGVTKVQLGVQSLDDHILELNRRGHRAEDSRLATALLRATGFKIVLHWMPNLLGATLESDRADFARLWKICCPDEIKIYPNQLLENTDLFSLWLGGQYQPYTTEELVDLIADLKSTIPRYCRVNRVVRDIPSTYVVAGNKRTSLRQDIQQAMKGRGQPCQCVRCREVRSRKVAVDKLRMNDHVYSVGDTQEHFLSFDTPNDKLAGYLRLSLPGSASAEVHMSDLHRAAIIREVHVYGQSLPVGSEEDGAAQHIGLGTRLIERAEVIARNSGYPRLAVISAVGTRQYYLRLGFERGELYLTKDLIQ